MGDDITIGVTEIVNNIEVTAQPNDQIVDISVIDNADDVTLNITPTVIEININKGSSYAKWGTILGTLSDQEDLQDALDLKADLVDGKVPSSQLPSYVDDIIEVANYAALPATGETGKIYVTIDNNKIFRWTGSTYVEIIDSAAVWGAITGTLSSQTDLQTALDTKALKTITITPNAPLSGGGDLSANITISISQANTSTDGYLSSTDWNTFNGKQALLSGTGIVKSVGGTISYLTDNSANWDAAYNDKINSAAVTGTTTKTLTLTQQDGGTVTASWSDIGDNLSFTSPLVNTAGVVSIPAASGSVNGYLSSTNWTTFNNKENAITAGTTLQYYRGDKTFQTLNTSVVPELTNLYYTEARVNANTNVAANTAARHNAVTIGTANGLSLSTQVLSLGLASGSANGALSSTDWTTFNNKQNAITNLIDGIVLAGYIPKSTSATSGLTTLGNSAIYDNSGKIGIGTTSPSTILSVEGTNQISHKYNGGGGSSAPLYIGQFDSSGNVSINNAANADLWIGTNNSRAMTIKSGGNVGIGTTSPIDYSVFGYGANVENRGGRGGGFISTDSGATNRMVFSVDSAAAVGQIKTVTNTPLTFGVNDIERMRITSGGNVGIGTTAPNYASAGRQVVDINGSSQSMLALSVGGVGKSFLFYTGTDLLVSNESNGAIKFNTNGSEKAIITSAGNLGIGTTSPAYKLDVNGDINSGANLSTNTFNFRGDNFKTSSATIGKFSTLTQGATDFELIFNRSASGSGAYYSIQSVEQGIGYRNLLFQKDGGNVGIGTTAPLNKLHVDNGGIRLSDATNANFRGITFGASSTDSTEYAYIKYTPSTGEMRYWANPSGFGGFTSFYSNATESMRITSSGNVMINLSGTSAYLDGKINAFGNSTIPAACFKSESNAQFTTSFWNIGGGTVTLQQFVYGTAQSLVGSISSNGSTTSYNITSDYRLKEDFKSINGLDLVSKIKIYDFKFKNSDFRMGGVIAHELQDVVPYAVTGEKDAEQMQSVDYSKLVPVMIQAIQELKAEIEILKNK